MLTAVVAEVVPVHLAAVTEEASAVAGVPGADRVCEV